MINVMIAHRRLYMLYFPKSSERGVRHAARHVGNPQQNHQWKKTSFWGNRSGFTKLLFLIGQKPSVNFIFLD
jgi:hypothetical protein